MARRFEARADGGRIVAKGTTAGRTGTTVTSTDVAAIIAAAESMPPMRIAFSGFQRQVNQRTVQGVVEAALAGLGWEGRAILAAGRTDTGVHAFGQVIAFDLDFFLANL